MIKGVPDAEYVENFLLNLENYFIHVKIRYDDT